MKVGFIILCRYNSKRLPGKILKKIKDKPILQYIIERLLVITDRENIVIATSDGDTDNPIEDFCIKNNIKIYRGPLENVALRFMNCALENKFDFATRINGDNIFVYIEGITQMLKYVKTNQYDFISNVKNRTFPKGMSVEIVRTKHYKKIYTEFNKNEHFEHVTLYLYQNDIDKKYYYFYNDVCPDAADIQFAIDDEKDFKQAEQIISNFTDKHTTYGLYDIYNFYLKINDN